MSSFSFLLRAFAFRPSTDACAFNSRKSEEGLVFFVKGWGNPMLLFYQMVKYQGNLLHDFTTKYSKKRDQSCS